MGRVAQLRVQRPELEQLGSDCLQGLELIPQAFSASVSSHVKGDLPAGLTGLL